MSLQDDLLTNSEQRLWDLIAQRTRTGADTRAIDDRIWKLFGERWAVAFTDLSGFSRATERFGIIHFLQVIYEMRRLLYPVIADHGGILVKPEADSLLLLFRDAASALRCSIAMQRACQAESERLVDEEKILLCIGIGFGDILRVGQHEAWGSEVNAASKLGEDTAKAHEILVTEAVREACAKVEGITFLDLGLAVAGSAQNYRVKYR